MLESIDYMHWIPALTTCIGSGKIVLQPGKHAFFGMPGSHNDINMLEISSIFTEFAQGRALPINYTINGNDYAMRYYLDDGIYPKWQTFVKTIPSPQGNKKKIFVKA
ncbi:uncharacterized protein LOC118348153 [Juglans regia]|uniref:Uncharacterized protein LOC118348153 n=1 Tax=Juglans regia TaxID=51240 RepID=A0A6P9ER40_JUGRE|nr:uncharacterized protein LOC118348153 [Juglans regia]